MPRMFKEIEVGEHDETVGRTVSESDVYRYAGLEGHYGALHTNKPYMREHSEYGRRIAHGGLLVVLTNGFMTQIPWDVDVVALYGFDRVRFVNPVFIGDTVHLESEIVAKEPRNAGSGIVTFDCELRKEDGTPAMVMKWHYLVRRGEGEADRMEADKAVDTGPGEDTPRDRPDDRPSRGSSE